MDENMNASVEATAEGAEGNTGEGVVTGTDAGTAEVKATEDRTRQNRVPSTQESGESASGASSELGSAEFTGSLPKANSVSDEEPSADGTEPPDGAQSDEGDASEQGAGERAINAIKRRKFERKQELQRVREQTIIETLGGINPYTGEKMEDSADISQYLIMREIKSRGGDPVGEYAKYHKIMEREKAQREAEEAAAQKEADERAAAHDRDMQAFREKFPDVTAQSMMNDGDFMAYAKGRVGKDGNIYAVYSSYRSAKDAEQARVELRARELAAQQMANASATPGTAVGEAGGEPDYFTREQVQAMTQKQVHQNYEKIKKSMKHWK